MRVAQFSEFGGPEALRLEEVPEPTPAAGEILISVTAVGLNFFDTLQLRNQYQVTPTLPFSPGAEMAGTVEALGPGVSGLALGQRVRGLYRRQWLPREGGDQGEERRSDSRWGQRRGRGRDSRHLRHGALGLKDRGR